MYPTRPDARRAASTTEVLLIVVGIGVALLLAATLFGNKLSRIWYGSTKSLDGAPAAGPQPDTLLSNTGGSGAANNGGSGSGGSTTTPTSAPAAGTGTIATAAFGTEFDEAAKKIVSNAIAKLPKALQGLPLDGITFTSGQNASFNSTKNTLLLGPFVIDPNGTRNVNDFLENTTGVNPGFTLERTLFHEALHDFNKQNPAGVGLAFTEQGFKDKVKALEADPKFQEAKDAISSAEFEIEKRYGENHRALETELLLGCEIYVYVAIAWRS